MRTTVKLEIDIVKRLEHLSGGQRTRFEQLVDEAIRLGLDVMEKPATPTRYRIQPVHLAPILPNLDKISDVLATLDGEQNE